MDVDYKLEAEGELVWTCAGGHSHSFTCPGPSHVQMDMAMKMAPQGQKMTIEYGMELSGTTDSRSPSSEPVARRPARGRGRRVRYAPDRAFPGYAYLPGRDPHPTRDPRGHSHGHVVETARYLEADRWHENEEYLFGVDLYNEATCGRLTSVGELVAPREARSRPGELPPGPDPVQRGEPEDPDAAARRLARLAEMGTGRLEEVARRAGPHFMGVDVPAFSRPSARSPLPRRSPRRRARGSCSPESRRMSALGFEIDPDIAQASTPPGPSTPIRRSSSA
jgi:hypothetical protein